MSGAFYIGATGLDAQQRALDVVANNIANLNTTGFKRSTIQFSSIMAAGAADDGDPSADGSANLLGVSVDTSQTDFTQGQLSQTGSALSLAISGPGFIELMGPGGQSLLWRGGTLQVNSDGYLAASNGMALKGLIAVPQGASALTISADGKVYVTPAGATAAKQIGQIDLVQDKDMSTLAGISGGLYQATSAGDLVTSGPGEDGAGSLVQGSVEISNVDLTTEMVSLVMLQRAYSASAQVVQAGDQLMQIANSLRR